MIGDCGVTMHNINGSIKLKYGIILLKSINSKVMPKKLHKELVTGLLRTLRLILSVHI